MPAPIKPMPAAHGVDPAIVQSIRQASRATNTDFGLLMAQAAQESGFQPDAKAHSSSATGLFQFVDSTWLDMVRRFGDKYGIGPLAQQIGRDGSGRPVVGDAATRQRILELRKDPRLSAALAGEYTRLNKEEVERALGRTAGRADLYMAHFLGAGGATAFLKAVERNGGAVAAELLPEAAAANHSVFYDGQTGRPRTVAEIYRNFASRIEKDARDLGGDASSPPSEEAAKAGGPLPSTHKLDGIGGRLSEPLAAMLNVFALTALRLAGGDASSTALHSPPSPTRDRRPL